MPIYEFRCAECGAVQEFIVSASDSEKQLEMACKACDATKLERVLSRVSYTMGGSKGAQPTVTNKNCGSGNTCSTIDFPGPSS